MLLAVVAPALAVPHTAHPSPASPGDDVGVSGFECSLDGAVFSPCSSPTSYINLTGGAHSFQVRAVDTSGSKDASPASFSWSISGRGKK